MNPSGKGNPSLQAHRSERTIAVVDLACGRCNECRTGHGLWCRDPQSDGPTLLEVETPARSADLMRWLTAAAALPAALLAADAVVLVLAEGAVGPLAELVRLLHPGVVLVSENAADPTVRSRLAALTASGRADMVLTTEQARNAVKAVVRGGAVCLPAAPVVAPSITELVQREVRLVVAQDVRPVIERLGRATVQRALAAS